VEGMNVSYFYCPSCGYEDFDIYVGYVRATADSEWCECPKCGEESSVFDIEE
jgi:predicted RNA-binding Zn-ribbon protein involved in translation (DUF1610 family)